MAKYKEKFQKPKMLSSRIEQSDYDKLDLILKFKMGMTVQEFINFTTRQVISGNLIYDSKNNQFKVSASYGR